MERLRPAGRVRRRAARLGLRRPSRSRRWCSSARSTRTSCCGSAATGSRPSGCAATTGCCSASRRWAAREGEDIGFVGRIERIDADVIRHVAEDYIPVIASVGADRNGRSHNVNADEAAGAVARALGAYKVVFLTDVPGWLRRPGRPRVGDLRDDGRRGRGRAAARRGRDAAEARGVPERDLRRRRLRAHHRRPHAALAAAGAVHRRRHRDQGAGPRGDRPR